MSFSSSVSLARQMPQRLAAVALGLLLLASFAPSPALAGSKSPAAVAVAVTKIPIIGQPNNKVYNAISVGSGAQELECTRYFVHNADKISVCKARKKADVGKKKSGSGTIPSYLVKVAKDSCAACKAAVEAEHRFYTNHKAGNFEGFFNPSEIIRSNGYTAFSINYRQRLIDYVQARGVLTLAHQRVVLTKWLSFLAKFYELRGARYIFAAHSALIELKGAAPCVQAYDFYNANLWSTDPPARVREKKFCIKSGDENGFASFVDIMNTPQPTGVAAGQQVTTNTQVEVVRFKLKLRTGNAYNTPDEMKQDPFFTARI